jgi:hypothetical protein
MPSSGVHQPLVLTAVPHKCPCTFLGCWKNHIQGESSLAHSPPLWPCCGRLLASEKRLPGEHLRALLDLAHHRPIGCLARQKQRPLPDLLISAPA